MTRKPIMRKEWHATSLRRSSLANKLLENGKAVIVPLDHGVTEGPVKGIEHILSIAAKVERYATALIVHKGMVRALDGRVRCKLIMHGSASTNVGPDPDFKVQVATPEEAARMRCNAFSLHVNIGGNEHEPDMLAALAKAVAECQLKKLPLLAMMYPRGPNVKTITPALIAHAARVGAELGADLVKCPYTGSPESFRCVVESVPVPVLIAGGPKRRGNRLLLDTIAGAMEAGAAGVSIGRNIYAHDHPELMVRAIRMIVIEGERVGEAMKMFKKRRSIK